MTVSTPRWNIGHHVFGIVALGFGLIALIWHDYNNWDQLRPVFVAIFATAQVLGGVAIQFRRTAKAGAVLVGAIYLLFAIFYVPRIVAAPQIYDHWGNFFEQFSLVTGAMIVYALASPEWAPQRAAQLGRALFGLCTVSFTLEQAFYLRNTAVLVPKWIPPSQMFWAVITTVLFALSAVALLANRKALLAARLLTAMLVSFGLLVWMPLLFSNPRSYTNWSEGIETWAIAGAAWVLVDLLRATRHSGRRAQ